MKITIYPKPHWKDKWVEKSPSPITEMFYRSVGRLPIKKELKLYIEMIVMPNNKWHETYKKLHRLIKKNDKKGRRKIASEFPKGKRSPSRAML